MATFSLRARCGWCWLLLLQGRLNIDPSARQSLHSFRGSPTWCKNDDHPLSWYIPPKKHEAELGTWIGGWEVRGDLCILHKKGFKSAHHQSKPPTKEYLKLKGRCSTNTMCQRILRDIWVGLGETEGHSLPSHTKSPGRLITTHQPQARVCLFVCVRAALFLGTRF